MGFVKRVDCRVMSLPAEPVLRTLLQQTATHQQRLGKEIGKRALVLPNGKFFPDKFTGDHASVVALLRRMQGHAGMSDIPIEVRILGGTADDAKANCGTGCGCGPSVTAPDQPPKKKHECSGDCGGKGCADCDGSCHSKDEAKKTPAKAAASCVSGCGSSAALPSDTLGDEPRLVDLGDGWRIQVPNGELLHPVALTTNLARALGIVFLLETTPSGVRLPSPIEPQAEIVGCLLGFGSLLLAGSYVYTKSCGGPRVGKVTALGPYELGLVTVLFAKLQNQELRPLLRELEVTQKDAVTVAADWLDERPALVEGFMTEPAKLASGDFSMTATPKGFFSRLFGSSKPTRKNELTGDGDLAELEAMLSNAEPVTAKRTAPKPDPKRDELRALVDEALRSTEAHPE